MKKETSHNERYKDGKYEIYWNGFSEKYVLKEYQGGCYINVIGRYDTYKQARDMLQVCQEYDRGLRKK